jgi:four helix bundle protein
LLIANRLSYLMFRFESLDIWKLAVEYGNKLYDIADSLPKEEIYGLSSQLRRAAVSISNNIAEGSGANTNRDFSCFLDISIKSTLETVNILSFALLRNYISETKQKELYEIAERLIRKIRAFKKILK